MALPATVDRLEDLPELVRDHYMQKEGVWTLTLLSSEDHAGLVSALDKERKTRREVETQLSTMKTRYDGIDPDEVLQLKDKMDNLKDKEIYDKHGLEELVSRRTDTMKQDHERVTRAKDQEIVKLKDSLTTSEQRRKQDKIKTALLNAVSSAGVDKDALEDAVARGQAVFTDVDEHDNVISRNGEEIRYSKDGVNPLSPGEWISALKAEGKARHLWPPSSGGGAPPQHGGTGAGTDWLKITNPVERATRYREAQAAGKA